MTSWLYDGKPFTPDMIGNNEAFVYRITDIESGKKYIGKKHFNHYKTLPPLKGKTRKRKVVKESDWLAYYGSNDELKALVAEKSRDCFRREILRLCRTKSEASYFEAKFQFEYDVLLDPDYFNEWIMVRVSRSHVKGAHLSF